MPKTIEQTVTFRTTPERLYRLYLSSRQHAAACGGWGKATIQARVGGRMAMAPHITGKFLSLVPGKLIVQTWRGSDWKRSELESVLILAFSRRRGACRLVMVHANVPDAHARSITKGWFTYYWRPWKKYLRARRA
jgi:uncharacterized protein YndB with AHSA1/START domain